MSQLNELTIFILLAITLISLISLLSLILFCIIPMKKRMNELSRIMYMILRKDEKYDNSHDSIKHALVTINDNIGSLSSSTNKVLAHILNTNKRSGNLPTPSLSKEIRDTIMENINVEVLMSKGMRTPNRESIIHIAENTIKTYTHIDMEYIIKMTLSMVENYILSVTESQDLPK